MTALGTLTLRDVCVGLHEAASSRLRHVGSLGTPLVCQAPALKCHSTTREGKGLVGDVGDAEWGHGFVRSTPFHFFIL